MGLKLVYGGYSLKNLVITYLGRNLNWRSIDAPKRTCAVNLKQNGR